MHKYYNEFGILFWKWPEVYLWKGSGEQLQLVNNRYVVEEIFCDQKESHNTRCGWVCLITHTHTLCLIGRCYSCVTRCSLVYFYAFTYCFSWTELCISKLKMCFMLKLFPSIRINLHLQNKRYNKKQSVLLRHVCFFFVL